MQSSSYQWYDLPFDIWISPVSDSLGDEGPLIQLTIVHMILPKCDGVIGTMHYCTHDCDWFASQSVCFECYDGTKFADTVVVYLATATGIFSDCYRTWKVTMLATDNSTNKSQGSLWERDCTMSCIRGVDEVHIRQWRVKDLMYMRGQSGAVYEDC
jgi:hypothetical protein